MTLEELEHEIDKAEALQTQLQTQLRTELEETDEAQRR